MSAKTKTKNPNRLQFKDYFGTTLMNLMESIGAALMTSWFMQYLTDYSGIGEWGAVLGTILLLVTRLFDAVNDPIESWIMDRAKPGKLGKYKPFIILSILLTGTGLIALFFLPSGLANSPVLICVWVVFFYLLYDIGSSFYAPNLIYRSLTTDSVSRSKLIIGPRMVSMIVGMAAAGIVGMVNAVNQSVNNLHHSFGIVVTVMVVILGVLSMIGILMIKEKYHAVDDNDEEVKITDIFKVLKHNKALSTMTLSVVFSGFIWTFLFATMLYYVKWGYCADLATGVLDDARYGTLSLVGSMMMFLPLIIGTIVATPLMKAVKDPMVLHRFLMLVEGAAGLLIFILHIVGLLPKSPILFFGILAITATCIGIDYIPQETINIECMDYELLVGGKERAALCNACNKFVNKAQNAISASLVGAVLWAIGYVVDSTTGDYIGELSKLPSMLTWFVVIMGLIPFVLSNAAYFILAKYPINDEVRKQMKDHLK